VDPSAEGDDESKVFDNDSLTRLFIQQTTEPTCSFVVDLEGSMEVRSFAMWGRPSYDSGISMLSDTVSVEAANSASGPWTLIGSIDVGNTRPTDPDPTIGGENPWTGGNGRMISCTPTTATHLRISGGFGFDNNILLYHAEVNPKLIIHRMDPVWEGAAYMPLDPGGGTLNSRTPADCIDGNFATRTFFGLDVDLTLDLGVPTPVNDFRIHTSDNDAQAMVKEGVVRTSSTDDPNNFDTVETNFDAGTGQAHAQIFLPNQPNKRFFQMTFTRNRDGQTGTGTAPTYRMSEIDFRQPNEAPIYGAAVVGGSLLDNGVVDPGADGFVEANGIDDDYNTRFRIGQGSAGTTGFVVDLGGNQEITSVGMYGNWTYVQGIQMLSDDVTVEAGNSPSGPFSQIGSINVGNTRPTDPDPAIGGENPWTGGNGRLIPCTPTAASYLRISGGYGFDNNIDLFEVVINPQSVIQRVDPVDGYTLTAQDLWDVGGGVFNSRVGAEAFDRRLVTRVNPKGPLAFTVDLGALVTIEEVRIFPMESDLSQLPKTVTVRTSSTDSPTNMDTVEANFDSPFVGGATIIPIPSNPEKRYVQIDLQANQGGDPNGMRFGEIEVIGRRAGQVGPTPTPTQDPSAIQNWELY
ncbi:MAG: hypothetical protein KC964_15945, partial [Candidatus Omnitrophica bacterium]|nr:hypothetical protein [Candidatus Omnitrophota bacterium]